MRRAHRGFGNILAVPGPRACLWPSRRPTNAAVTPPMAPTETSNFTGFDRPVSTHAYLQRHVGLLLPSTPSADPPGSERSAYGLPRPPLRQA
jgi:hypothetical protein